MTAAAARVDDLVDGFVLRARRALRELRAIDVAIYDSVAATPTPALDGPLSRLSRTADQSLLWLSIAGALALRRGAPRRAAAVGVTSIAIASATANLGVKGLLPRTRPERPDGTVPAARLVRMPASRSFPSGHAAAGFAFASAVGAELPWTSLPLHLAAAAVAYSRVHTGVHYPWDVIMGAAIGSAIGATARRYR